MTVFFEAIRENGEPKVVYHGSLQWFQIFNDGKERHQSGAPDGTIFANDNREIAVSFVDYYGGKAEDVILDANDARHARMPWGVYRKGGIYSLFMNLKNPLVVDFEGMTWHGEKYDIKDVNWYAAEARKKGHDGLIIRNVIDVGFTDTNDVPPSTDYVAFESNQVKSATQNRGTFDGSNPDITMSVVGEHAANWDELKERAFKGRDDGKLRAEIDASQARLKKAPRHRMDSSVVDELVARLTFFREEVSRHGAWRRVEDEFSRRAIKGTLHEMLFLMRLVAPVGLDFESYAELQESGVLELALNPTVDNAKKLLRGRKIEGVLGFNKLGEILEYPELFAAYPQLAELPVRWMGPECKRRGAYVTGGRRFVKRRIEVRANRTPGGILSTLLHETQHWIQHEEDFAFGADTTDNGYNRTAGEIEARNVQHRRWMSADERVELPFDDTLEYPGEPVVAKTVSELMAASMSMSVIEAKDSGLFKDGVLEAINAVVVEPDASFSIEALHATPNRFRKFTTEKMGTGEGAQAYGWGLYFAENHGVNRNYFNKFNRVKTYLDDFKVGGQDATYNEWTQAIDNIIKSTVKNKDILTWIRSVFDYKLHGANPDGLIYQAKSAVKFARANIKKAVTDEIRESEKVKLRRGQCLEKIGKAIKASGLHAEYKAEKLNAANYRVELNVDDSNLLMWDSPVADELQAEIDAMQRHVADEDWQETFAEMKALGIKGDNSKRENFTGWQVYKELVSGMGAPKAASKWLAERGYKGIKYLDGVSRGKGEGTYNYVIFSGDDVKITGVNETGSFDAPWEDYVDPTASFSVVGEHAANWDELKERAFKGRDDGKLRVELDASGAKIKGFPKAYPVYDVMRKLMDAGVYDSDEYTVYSALRFVEDMIVDEKGEKKLNETDLKEDVDGIPDLVDEMERGLKAAGLTWNSNIQAVRGASFTALGRWKKKLEEELKGKSIEKPTGEAWHALVEQKPGLASANVGKRMVSSWSGKWLDDVLDFPELYKAYPQLRNIQLAEDFGLGLADASYSEFAARHGVTVGKDDGQYPLGVINMNPKSSAWSDERKVTRILLHEIQHAIQELEGFAKGANSKNGMDAYMRSAGEIESRNVEKRMDWSAFRREATPFNDTLEYPGEALVSFSVSPMLRDDIRRAAYNKLDSKYHIPLCTMPTVLRMLGVPEGDVYTHHLAHPEVYRAIEELDDPLFVFRDTEKSYLFVLEMVATNNMGVKSNVVVAIRMNRSASGHYLLSAYPLDALDKIRAQAEQKNLVYSKYTVEELEEIINKQATPPTDGASVFFQSALVRSAVKGGLRRDIPTKSDVVKWKDDFSASMVRLNEEYLVQDLVAAGGGFKANVEFVDKMVREMRQSLQRLKRLGSKTRTEREDAIAAMGSIVHMVKAVVQYLPKGYRFSVHPYVNKLEMLAEIATTGAIELTEEHNDMATRPLKKWLKVQRGLRDVMAMKGQELDVEQSVDELIREHGEMMLTETVERIIERVAEQLRKHAKARVTEKIQELVKRLAPKRDKKSGKLKGGKMSADAYRDLEDVAIAMAMDEDELKAKLDALNAKLAEPGLSEDDRAKVESELALYDQFGNLQGMTAAEAMEAYEALRRRVWMHRFEWDNVMAERRVAQRAMAQSVVDAVGAVQENEYNAAKRVKGPVKRLKNVGDILAGLPQVMVSLRGYLPLRKMVDDLTRRANRAGEQLKAWEAERWEKLEALARKTMGKSWRLCMDDMHKVQKTGVSFDRPVYRTVSVRTEGLRELLAMSKTERRAEMKQRREAGGLEAETVLSERDIEALKGKLAEMEAAGRVLSVVEVKYVAEVRHEENLELSKGEALYAILMYEQPTYTERLEAQGYTPEVIAGFKRFIGEGVLQFGYGLREMFAEQGDRVAAVYERTFGVPFPREENYFAARWDLREKKGGPAEQLLAGMTGTPGAGNGWQKQRVNHNLELDMTKDALQVFLQATSLTDNWMATQDIVADFKAWTRNRDFAPAVTVMIGKDGYQNLVDWINLLEMGGVNDCLNMGASQDVINGLYGSGAVAILGLRIQTLIRQLPSVFNGLLGAYDISTGEWLATLAKMKHGDAPMTFKRMKDSVLIKNRQTGRAGAMAGQATRSNDMKSSKTEELILASMLPMEWVDARCTAMSLVPVWNVYYSRAVEAGASHAEAERAAWEETAIVANRSSQPVGWMNKSKIGQHRNPIVKSLFFMLSENTAKFALCRGLWQGGQKKAAVRAWLVYGAANAVISALLDWLQGDPDDWEKGAWWEYALSALYGPLAGIPGVGEAVEALTTVALQTTGEALDVEELKKARGRASVGRALVDFQGMYRAVKKIVGFMTDDEEHGLAEYTRAASTISRTMAIGTGWMGNAFGYWSTVVSVGMNPLDFAARVWRNMKQYYGEE